MVALESAHTAGLSLRGCFLCLAGLGSVYAVLSFDCVWQGLLAPPPAEVALAPKGTEAGVAGVELLVRGGGRSEVDPEVEGGLPATVAATVPTAPPAAAPQPSQYGAALDVSHRSLRGQLLSVHFLFIAAWALVAVFRTMFVLGTIGPQLHANGGGRGAARVEELVRLFNWLILSSVPLYVQSRKDRRLRPNLTAAAASRVALNGSAAHLEHCQEPEEPVGTGASPGTIDVALSTCRCPPRPPLDGSSTGSAWGEALRLSTPWASSALLGAFHSPFSVALLQPWKPSALLRAIHSPFSVVLLQ